MKKVFFSILLFICFTANSQVIKLDSIRNNESLIIAERLSDFHNENRVSQMAGVFAVGFTAAGLIMNNPSSKGVKACYIVAGICGTFSAVLYIDSFKFLNFKNSKAVKRRSDDYIQK